MNFTTLMQAIAELAQAEKVTKAKLSELSRQLLAYVLETADVRPINALLGKQEDGSFTLTSVNWRVACQYFHHFLPFTSNYKDVRDCVINGGKREELIFEKKDKKRFDVKSELIADWLSDESNDIWAWSNDVKVEVKPTDYAARITKAVEAGMNEDKGGLSMNEVMAAVLAAGVSINDMLDAVANVEKADKLIAETIGETVVEEPNF